MARYFRKADILLIAGLLIIGAAGAFFALRTDGGAAYAVITVEGKVMGRYPLSVDRTIGVDTSFGHNTVEIRDGTVAVTDSDCPGHDCMNFGRVGPGGGMIVCLPHRLVISVSGGDAPDVDAVVY